MHVAHGTGRADHPTAAAVGQLGADRTVAGRDVVAGGADDGHVVVVQPAAVDGNPLRQRLVADDVQHAAARQRAEGVGQQVAVGRTEDDQVVHALAGAGVGSAARYQVGQRVAKVARFQPVHHHDLDAQFSRPRVQPGRKGGRHVGQDDRVGVAVAVEAAADGVVVAA